LDHSSAAIGSAFWYSDTRSLARRSLPLNVEERLVQASAVLA
jgi:hypothetical protein